MKQLLFFLILLVSVQNYASSWELLETKYERIFYPKTHKQMAVEVAYYIEKNREKVLTLSGRKTPYPIYYTIQDLGMISNGYSSIIDNKIGIFTPAPGSSLTEYFDYNWLETVSIHELFHNYHVHNVSGVNSILKEMIGNFNPHIWLPNTIIEGLATYQESQLNPYQGRLNTGFFDALMLTKAKEQKLLSFTQASNVLNHFPISQHYLYGSTFMRYLADTYSEESLTQFLTNYGSKFGLNPLLSFPAFGIDTTQNAYKKSFNKLYQDFTLNLKEKATNWRLPSNPVTKGTYLSIPLITNDTIYLLKQNLLNSNVYTLNKNYQLVAINQKTKKESVLKTFNALSGHPLIAPLQLYKNKLYIGFTSENIGFLNIDNYGIGLNTTIYSYNLKTEQFKKEASDTISAFMIHSNDDLIYAKQIPGQHKTKIINNKTNQSLAEHPLYITTMTQSNDNIYLTAKQAEGSSNIYQTDTSFNQLTPIIDTNYIETYPTISNQWLYYTANYQKQFQIYRYNLQSKNIEKLSGPSFMTKPTISNNNLHYISLDSESMSLHETKINTTPMTLTNKETITKPSQTKQFQNLNYKIYSGKNVWFKNFLTLAPIVRLPMLTKVNNDIGVGLFFQGYDKLGYTTYVTSILNLIDSETSKNKNQWIIYGLNVTTKAIKPLEINYNHTLNTRSLSAITPIYISSINPIQYIYTGVETNFNDILTYLKLASNFNNTKATLKTITSLNKNPTYEIETSLSQLFKTSQVSLIIKNYEKQDIILNQRGVLKEFSNISSHSLSINYSRHLKSILKSSYALNTTIESAYINLYSDYLPYYSKNILYGFELLLEVKALFSFVNQTGIQFENNNNPEFYTTLVLSI
jgi:hypothetical protein